VSKGLNGKKHFRKAPAITLRQKRAAKQAKHPGKPPGKGAVLH
jgi:hypothetical protein